MDRILHHRPGGRLAKTIAYGAVMAACAGGAWFLQTRHAAGMPAGEDANAPTGLAIAGLGGFRGIIAEIVWFRADRLQDEGRYAELAQLAAVLTMLEPHTPEIWAYAAWNLAYNISVMMPDAPERWRWVEAGIRLLRDDGLRLNPRNPVLYRELAWMFLAKVGGNFDSASPYYTEQWRGRIAGAQASGDWKPLAMDPALMEETEREYGALDWALPLSSALYWAHRGLSCSKGTEDRRELRQIVWQALMLLSKDDASFAPRALEEMRTAYGETPSPALLDLIGRFRARFLAPATKAEIPPHDGKAR